MHLGPLEIGLIIVLVLIIFGAGKLPQVGGAMLSISEMGHFLNRTIWPNQSALASFLRPRLYSLRRLIVCICTSFRRSRISSLLPYKTSAGVTLPSALW